MSSVAELLQQQLEPYLSDTVQSGGALEIFLAGLAQMYEDIKTLADDDDEGNVGWSILLDINRAPSNALPWLGQFVGAIVDPSLSDADQRQQILDVSGWKRGSVDAMRGAALPYLSGNKTVIFSERDSGASATDPAYGLIVYTRTTETLDADAIEAALLALKPAGIVLQFKTVAGQIYEDIFLHQATYGVVLTTFDDYQSVLLGGNIGTTGTGGTGGGGSPSGVFLGTALLGDPASTLGG